MPTVIAGHLLKPGAAQRHPAQLLCDAQGITLNSEIRRCRFRWHEVTIGVELGNLPRTVTFADGWIFTPTDHRQFNRLLSTLHGHSWLSRLEGKLSWIAIAVVVTVVASFAGLNYGIPLVARHIAPYVPLSVVQQLGERSKALLDRGDFSATELPLARRQALRQQFEGLVEELIRQDKTFRIRPRLLFRSVDSEANAFTLAGGTIVLTDQMVELADNDQQLQAVLLHELGHVYHHHLMNKLVQSSMLSIAVALMVGDHSGIADTLSGPGVFLLTMRYSRDDERQADRFAAQALLEQGRSTQPMLQLYQRLLAQQPHQGELPQWLSTHPDLRERIATLRELDDK